MADPVDYIDLTVDSPGNKFLLKSRTRNTENVSVNIAVTKRRRKRNLSNQPELQLHDSVIEIPVEDTSTSKQPINTDQINSPKYGIYCGNDYTPESLIPLLCPICYEYYSSKIRPISTRCGHVFCTQCLEQALRNLKKCPTCKTAVKFNQCTRLHL
ncbi:E3 ubiquitin-protein ligase RNF4-like [Colletes gigas]|uniref:E3 ubiquitin-protein ligase RNF4-like n=1 Tax=Colletes gigas TaxID=935657 RepID=UPI001C9A47A7|nr:E3 ubiquitin-protein ligase RNF4-like [Colletes gigas]XP_043251484.1 E3 ubiquitin-protein ligase RNF4-like [Colletes gigas]